MFRSHNLLNNLSFNQTSTRKKVSATHGWTKIENKRKEERRWRTKVEEPLESLDQSLDGRWWFLVFLRPLNRSWEAAFFLFSVHVSLSDCPIVPLSFLCACVELQALFGLLIDVQGVSKKIHALKRKVEPWFEFWMSMALCRKHVIFKIWLIK